MRTYCIAQGALPNALCGDLNQKEITKRGDLCIRVVNSLCCSVEANTTLQSNYSAKEKTLLKRRKPRHYIAALALYWKDHFKRSLVNTKNYDWDNVFLELSCFFYDSTEVGNLTSGSSAFSKSSLNIWKFSVHILLKPSLEDFEHCFTSMWDECNCAIGWTFFPLCPYSSNSYFKRCIAHIFQLLALLYIIWS